MQNLTALILTAGVGKRIKPLVTSKPLIPFAGQTLLDRAIHNFKTIGINKFLVVINPKDKEKLKSYPAVVQTKPTGMAGAVLATRSVLAGPTVVVNGDDFVDPKIFTQFNQVIKTSPDKIILTGIKNRPGLSGGFFDLQGPTLKVIEKPQGPQPSSWLKLVLDYFPKIEDFMIALASTNSGKDDLYEQALNKLPNLKLIKVQGDFQPLKYPWHVLDLTAFFLSKYKGKSIIHPSAKIFPGAHIINSYLGPQVVIGHNALIRNSIIETSSVVGYNTEIARSYVGPRNNFHANYVGDSVIEADCNLGSGATLANLRFDKKDILSGRQKLGAMMGQGSQLGINVSVMPGVSIGSKAIVASGLVLAKSLEAGEFKKN